MLAAHDASDGGLAVALAEMAFAAADGPIGIAVDAACPCAWAGDAVGHAEAMFAEPGGFVLEVRDAGRFAQLASDLGIAVVTLGRTTDRATFDAFGHTIDLAHLREVWEAPLRAFYA